MKKKMYNSKEDFEIKNPYVTVIFSTVQPAYIEKSFSSKKAAENAMYNFKVYGNVLTRLQADRQIKKWNENYFPETIYQS